MEYKNLSIASMKGNSQDVGTLVGYASTYEVDTVGDRIMPGAFKNLPEFRKDGFLSVGHDWTLPPAGMITEAREDPGGLYVEAQFHSIPAAQAARRVAQERLQRGKTVFLSIGMEVLDAERGRDGIRNLLAIKLYEVGIVTVAANRGARVAQMKGLEIAPPPYIAKRGEVEGLFCIYGVIDEEGDRFHPGVFKHEGETQIPFLHRHEWGAGAVAEVKAIREITRDELPALIKVMYPEATGGAMVVRQYYGNNNGISAKQWAQKSKMGMSFTFSVDREAVSIENGREVRDIYRADLYEICDTPYPVVPGTMAWTGNNQFSFLKGRYSRCLE